METTFEFLPAGGRSRRVWKWRDEAKPRVVAKTLKPGVTVNEVADRHGMPANHVSFWRTLARKERPVLPAPEDPIEFASLTVSAAEVAPHATVGVATGPEIVLGAMVIRLEIRATAELIASVVRALAVCP